MADTEKRTFDLPADQAAFIDEQVARGAFASQNEVVSEGLRELQERKAEIERWLHEEVAPTYDEMEAHPERAISSEEWFDSVRKLHAAYSKTEG
jgi:antitoxin ParD1/3/4